MSLLPPILRPRWTLKYIVASAAFLYFSYWLLTGQPFFSSDLPNYSGPHDVGTITLEVPLETPRSISNVIYTDTGLPAFELETVLFDVFYPAEKGSKTKRPHHYWVKRPISLIGEGYARFARINNFVTNRVFTFGLWALAGGRKIPAKVDVPIHYSTEKLSDNRVKGHESESSSHSSTSNTFPVIVFSHGMASSRTDYTHYCGELASRGYIVAAVEHRDGSSPASVVMQSDGSTRTVFHVSTNKLQRKEGLPNIETAELKEIQLAFRQAEMEEATKVLRSINDGHGAKVHKSSSRMEGATLEKWRGRLDFDQFVVSGHSYGATLALQTLKDAPSAIFPVSGAIVLDPGKHSGPLNDAIDVPTLVIHSDSWSSKHSIFFGRPHFDVVKDLVNGVLERGKAAWFLTSVGTSHPSVTDAPLLEPLLLSWTTGATVDVREGVNQYVKVSIDFLEYLVTGQKQGILAEAVTHPSYGNDTRDDTRREKMGKEIAKYWQIHVSPTKDHM